MTENTIRKTIGGTAISSVVDLNPYKDKHALWLELTGRVGPTEMNAAMARGIRYEPVVAEIYQAGHGEEEVFANLDRTSEPCHVVDEDYEFITGSPDRILFREGQPWGGLEIKTASLSTIQSWGEEGTDQVPVHYNLQCQQYMALTGLHNWRLAVLFFLTDDKPCSYREYQIPFDPELWSFLRKSAVDFWNTYILGDKAPEITKETDATIRYLREQHPTDLEPIAEANEAEEALVSQCFALKTALDAAEEAYDAAKMRVMETIGDRAGLVLPDGRKITWKKSKDTTRVDWRGLAEAMKPDEEMKSRFTSVQTGARRFVMTEKKGGSK